MRVHTFESREIRSFRLLKRALNLNAFFNSSTREACFIMSDAIQPQDRRDFRETLAKYNLKCTVLSKKVVNLWMQNPQWGVLKELFKGNIVKVESVSKESGEHLTFNEEKLNFVMTHESFFLSFFIDNQKIERKEKMNTFLSRSLAGANFKQEIVVESLKAPLLIETFASKGSQDSGNY